MKIHTALLLSFITALETYAGTWQATSLRGSSNVLITIFPSAEDQDTQLYKNLHSGLFFKCDLNTINDPNFTSPTMRFSLVPGDPNTWRQGALAERHYISLNLHHLDSPILSGICSALPEENGRSLGTITLEAAREQGQPGEALFPNL